MDAKQILVLSPKMIQSSIQRRLAEIFKRMKNREIGAIFSELGASSSEQASLDKVQPDRRELDKIIMGEILGLTDEEQLAVYRAIVDLVKSRLEKAKSFGKRKKTKEGIDIDRLVKLVLEKIGEETLGKFYQEKVLSQQALYTKSLPKPAVNVSIKESLLGWRLYSDNEYVDCASELEARYLRVWLQAGWDKVKVPQDQSYFQGIVPELESLKQRIDEAIEPYLSSIVNVKTRDRVLRQLWVEVTKGMSSE